MKLDRMGSTIKIRNLRIRRVKFVRPCCKLESCCWSSERREDRAVCSSVSFMIYIEGGRSLTPMAMNGVHRREILR